MLWYEVWRSSVVYAKACFTLHSVFLKYCLLESMLDKNQCLNLTQLLGTSYQKTLEFFLLLKLLQWNTKWKKCINEQILCREWLRNVHASRMQEYLLDVFNLTCATVFI